MSTTKQTRSKPPRHEVISVRLNQDRLELLERHRQVLAHQLGRDVSLGEAAFLVIEGRAVEVDRETSRHLLMQTPTESLYQIKRRWATHHALSAAEWDVLAEYVLIATEQDRLEPPVLRPAVPSRESYLAVLDAFDAVYRHRAHEASAHTWVYFGNLEGFFTDATLSETDADQRHQTILDQVARVRKALQPEDAWRRPGNVGRCFVVAIEEEGVASTTLDHLLAPYWPTLWALAARGHWIRLARPIRAGGMMDDVRLQLTLPKPITAEPFTVSFVPVGLELTTVIDLPARQSSYGISRYPELVEFRALLEGVREGSWKGKYFRAAVATTGRATTVKLWLKQHEVRLEFSMAEWHTLRDLFRQAWKSPELLRWTLELEQEYGEHG
jgi:hypothetical protein